VRVLPPRTRAHGRSRHLSGIWATLAEKLPQARLKQEEQATFVQSPTFRAVDVMRKMTSTEGVAMPKPSSPTIDYAPKRSFSLTPRALHHAGFVIKDAAKTADFYSRIMGMEFVATVMGDRAPSTGDPFPYLHLFFRMEDGSSLAFFEAPGVPPPAESTHPAYDVFNHMALAVASKADVNAWGKWLRENGINVTGPTHPDGNRLELTTTLDQTWDRRHADAVRDLNDWVSVKSGALARGGDPKTALLGLIRDRKKEMHERGIRTSDSLHDA
jgi:catechol 2,3-dioxygenase-like lactoylglutathione lyase family enzyme